MTTVAMFEREALPLLPALRHYAESLCRDRHRTDDLVQETMMKAFRYFDSYKVGTNCRAWLFQICKHAFINDYRRRQYEPLAVDFQDAAGPAQGEESGEERSVRVDLHDEGSMQDDSAMLGDEVTKALEGLPPDYQTVLVLNDIEEYTYEETADFMNVPIGTIRSRIHRARKMMAIRLEEYARTRALR